MLALSLLFLSAWPHQQASASANDDLVAYMTKICSFMATTPSYNSQFCGGASTCSCSWVDPLQSTSVRTGAPAEFTTSRTASHMPSRS